MLGGICFELRDAQLITSAPNNLRVPPTSHIYLKVSVTRAEND